MYGTRRADANPFTLIRTDGQRIRKAMGDLVREESVMDEWFDE